MKGRKMGNQKRKIVSLDDLRNIPLGGSVTFLVPDGRGIFSARNQCNHLRRIGELEAGYKLVTTADYDNLSITISKIRTDD